MINGQIVNKQQVKIMHILSNLSIERHCPIKEMAKMFDIQFLGTAEKTETSRFQITLVVKQIKVYTQLMN